LKAVPPSNEAFVKGLKTVKSVINSSTKLGSYRQKGWLFGSADRRGILIFRFRFLFGLLEMDELRNISCLSFLVTNALSLSLEFVSSSRCSSVTNALSLSLEFVSSSRCSSVPFGCYPSYKGFCFNFLAFVTEAHIAELKNSNKI
jgi:hypothetical protein